MFEGRPLVYNSCNYKVYIDNSFMYSNSDNACFAQVRDLNTSNVKKGIYKVVIWQNRNKLPFTEEEVVEYIRLLNGISFFKVELDLSDPEKYNFIVMPQEFKHKAIYVGMMMCIRYLWENAHSDKFIYVTRVFLNLVKMYPDEDLLYLLTMSHMAIPSLFGWNTNHTIVYTNSYPVREKDIVVKSTSTNATFSRMEKQPYNKGLKEYREIINKALNHENICSR